MNPDVILTTYGSYVDDPVKEVTDRKGWSDITAVEDEQIFDVNEDLVSRPGPRLVEGAEELAKAIYPDVFARSEEHTSELSHVAISYAVSCLNKKKKHG